MTTQLQKNFTIIDARSAVTGKDFLDKIWRMIVSVPVGVAIIHEDMSHWAIANVFYEMGMMDTLGKRTVIVKSPNVAIPSDFVRTEYIVADRALGKNLRAFMASVFEQEGHFKDLAKDAENNPLLAIDYLRRAYLISGDKRHRAEAKRLLTQAKLTKRATNSVEMLLAEF